MNYEVIDNKTFIVKIININNTLDDERLIKEILIRIRKRYAVNIYGFYEVDLYNVKNILNILIFRKTDNDNIFSNTIDLKIKKHSNDLNININNDYIIDNYNKKIKTDSNNIYKYCEHYSVDNINLLYN